MMQQPIKPPEYSPDKFVDRETEVNLVLERAHTLAEGRTVDRRVVIFTGERGTGKTWLLAHLQTELLALSGVTVFLFSLREYADWDPILA
ncbi:MAG TPA: ATP-binding protein, partial [Anaerolineae bacterium]|nr:ATP-binding protein [Anaerolineae bacterium]